MSYALGLLRAIYRNLHNDLPDFCAELSPEDKARQQKTAFAKGLYDAARAMEDGPHEHYGWWQISLSRRRYFAGKEKPSHPRQHVSYRSLGVRLAP